MNRSPINWQQVCLQLRQHYKPLARVAKEVGSTDRHLTRLARGDVEEPRFALGLRLLDLHHDHCRRVHTRAHLLAPHQARLRV